MGSLEQLHRAWQQVAENRICSAQLEGAFEKLRGLGRPLEEQMDIHDPNGWIRRAMRDCRDARGQGTPLPAVGNGGTDSIGPAIPE